MKLIAYLLIFFGMVGLIGIGPALFSTRRARNSTRKSIDVEAIEQINIAHSLILRHSAKFLLLYFAVLIVGTYILINNISFASATEQNVNRLWPLLVIYAFGFGVTMEATHRTSKVDGRLLSTELEWQLNGIMSALYLAFSAWFFMSAIEFMPWWALLALMFIGLQIGMAAAEILQKRMGMLRGFIFLASPIHLVWGSYILWSL